MSLKEQLIVDVLSSVEASFKKSNSLSKTALLDLKMPEGITMTGAGAVNALFSNKASSTDMLQGKETTGSNLEAENVALKNLDGGVSIEGGDVFGDGKDTDSRVGSGAGSSKIAEVGSSASVGMPFPEGLLLDGDKGPEGSLTANDKSAKEAQPTVGSGAGSSKITEVGSSASVGMPFPEGLPLDGDKGAEGSTPASEGGSEVSDVESSCSGGKSPQTTSLFGGSSSLQAEDFNPGDRSERAYPNAMERKRRRTIKEGFDSLLQSVSVLDKEDYSSKTSNTKVLKKTVSFIHFMNRKINKGREEISTLLRQNALLRSQIQILQKDCSSKKSARRAVVSEKRNDTRGDTSFFDSPK